MAVNKKVSILQCNRCQKYVPKDKLHTIHGGFGAIPTDPENKKKELLLREMCVKASKKRFKLFPHICDECIASKEVEKILYPTSTKTKKQKARKS